MAGDSEMGSTSLQVRLNLLHLSRKCVDLFRYSWFIFIKSTCSETLRYGHSISAVTIFWPKQKLGQSFLYKN